MIFQRPPRGAFFHADWGRTCAALLCSRSLGAGRAGRSYATWRRASRRRGWTSRSWTSTTGRATRVPSASTRPRPSSRTTGAGTASGAAATRARRPYAPCARTHTKAPCAAMQSANRHLYVRESSKGPSHHFLIPQFNFIADSHLERRQVNRRKSMLSLWHAMPPAQPLWSTATLPASTSRPTSSMAAMAGTSWDT